MAKDKFLFVYCSTGEITKTYSEYLLSRHWKAKRRHIFEIRKHTCEICNKHLTTRFEVHHLSYSSIGDEPDTDLQLLCHKCHTELHRILTIEKNNKNAKVCRKCHIKMKEKKTMWVCPSCNKQVMKPPTPKQHGKKKVPKIKRARRGA